MNFLDLEVCHFFIVFLIFFWNLNNQTIKKWVYDYYL